LAVRPLWGSWSDAEAKPRSWSSLRKQLEQTVALLVNRLTEGAELASEVGKLTLQALGLRASETPLPFDAPNTPFNVEIGDTRSFATAQLPLERTKAIGRAFNGTVNDVVMAVCAGALRRYLEERGQLPEKPLVAAVPMAARRADSDPSGNQVTATLVGLGTDIAAPCARLQKIIASSAEAKEHIHEMSLVATQDFLLAMSVITLLIQKLSMNVPISNIPGPRTTLYLKRARLLAIYPVSMLGKGTALNITLNSYEDSLFFGLIADSKAGVALDALAHYLEEAFGELEDVVAANQVSCA
jgi:WS/DGAT/MGAT family acyltransferase